MLGKHSFSHPMQPLWTTSHLSSLLCKSSVSKYMIMVRNVTNEITKKHIYIYIYIKIISYYHYGEVVYNFTHLKK